MLTRLVDADDYDNSDDCHECGKEIGSVLIWNDARGWRDHLWVDGWFLTGTDPNSRNNPKWCDDCVVPSPIPFHKEP